MVLTGIDYEELTADPDMEYRFLSTIESAVAGGILPINSSLDSIIPLNESLDEPVARSLDDGVAVTLRAVVLVGNRRSRKKLLDSAAEAIDSDKSDAISKAELTINSHS